ncbi:MAG: hypothetical protein M3O62_08790, partial [Pseudomonadota bacterium]|nr:hypothetical protein [Pseudomonadota bacterium]
LVLLGTAMIGFSLWRLGGATGGLPLPVAGTGVILLVAAFVLVCGGVLGELVYKLGDLRETDFSRLTSRIWDSGNHRSQPTRSPNG